MGLQYIKNKTPVIPTKRSAWRDPFPPQEKRKGFPALPAGRLDVACTELVECARNDNGFKISNLIPVLAVFLLFAFRLYLIPKLNLKDGDRVKITGNLDNEPQNLDNSQLVKLGQFAIWVKKYPEFHYGDKVEIVGKVKVKSLFSLTGSHPAWLNRYLINDANIKIVGAGLACPVPNGTGVPARNQRATTRVAPTETIMVKIRKLAIKLRSSILNVYNKSFPKPYDGIIAGIVVGDKSLIPKDFWDKLKKVGTLHIMVASGTNVVFIGNGLLSILLILFKRRLALLILIPLIWFYALVTGFEAPVIRSAIMLSFFYLSQIFGRESDGGIVLLATGSLMLLIDPLLIFNVGFQLSFLATAGLVFIQPKFVGAHHDAPAKNHWLTRAIRESPLPSTLSAQIATLPILVSAFGSFNLLSPIVNLMILWTVPYILAGGIILGMLGMLGLNLAKMASVLAVPLLFYIEQITNLFAKITFFQVQIGQIGWVVAVGYYGLLWLWIKKDSRR